MLPDDVKALAHAVLEHRVLITPEAELRGRTASEVFADILASVPVPGAVG